MEYGRLIGSIKIFRPCPLNLGTKIYLLIVIAVFIPLIFAMLFFNVYTVNTLRLRTMEAVGASFSQTYSVLAGKFESVRQNAQLMFNNDVPREAIMTDTNMLSMTQVRKTKDKIQGTLEYIEHKDDPFRVRVYVGEKGAKLADYQYYYPLGSASGTAWYTRLTNNPYRDLWAGGSLLDEIERQGGDNLRDHAVLSYFARFFDIDMYARTIAVLRLDFSKDSVEETLSQALTLNDGFACIISGDREIIAQSVSNPAPAWIIDAIKLSRLSYMEASSETITAPDGGDDYNVLYRAFKRHPWIMVMAVHVRSEDTLLTTIRDWNSVLLYAGVLGLLTFIVSLLFSRRIIRRVKLVSDSMRRLENSELKPLPSPRVKDETGQLIESYNYLTAKLQILISAREQAALNEKNAELRALRMQINPHFLHNTLELINYRAYYGTPEQVEHVVRQLSRFYKLCLNHGQEFCELRKELELTQTYFSIQNMRYEGKLSLAVDIPEKLYLMNIPNLILQPMVENAIRHGIMAAAEKSGSIVITGVEDEKDALITVADDGAGLSSEMLAVLNGEAPRPEIKDDTTPEDSGSHYGLKNINERLRGYYGSEYGLRFENGPERGMIVFIKIPH
ncbi:MAG: histidine kinase [Clostridiales bacterium]|jgi:two-component system sensor histidine kinase YesM|nr:histidine kinase [Clostridiales bacterium]